MPDVGALDIEGSFDECNGSRVADDSVFATCFAGFRWLNGGRIDLGTCCIGDSSDDFELYLMQVDGVGIFGEVMNLPGFTGTHARFFGGRVHPAHGHGHIHLHGLIELHGTEHSHDGSVEGRAGGRSHFVKRDFASDGCCREFGNGRDFKFGGGRIGAAGGGRDGRCIFSFDRFGGRVPGDSEFHHLSGGCRVTADHIGHAAEGGIGTEVEQLYFGADGQC